MIIRAANANDRAQWESLWQDSVDGALDKDVIDHSFNAITNGANAINALVAEGEDGDIIGLLHYVVHPVAGCIEPVCYMQDLFVSPEARRQGVAKSLMQGLEKLAADNKYDRIYWLLDKANEGAKEFYKNIGIPLEFGLYIIPVGMRERLNLPEKQIA